MIDEVDVLVIGAGSTGLTMAVTLQALGLQSLRDFLVVDAEAGPGGSWRRAWDFLRVREAIASGELFFVPGMSELGLEPGADRLDEPVRDFVPRSFALYEDANDTAVHRATRVLRVERVVRPRSRPVLRVLARCGDGALRSFRTRVVLNASGRWSAPFVPWYPGRDEFEGPQIAAARLERIDELAGLRVLVVGGRSTGRSLLRALVPIAGRVVWSRRAPWPDPPEGVASLPGPIERIGPGHVRFASGTEPIDAIVWATGSRDSARHLAPVHLRERTPPGRLPRLIEGWSRREPTIANLGAGLALPPAEARRRAISIAQEALGRLQDAR